MSPLMDPRSAVWPKDMGLYSRSRTRNWACMKLQSSLYYGVPLGKDRNWLLKTGDSNTGSFALYFGSRDLQNVTASDR